MPSIAPKYETQEELIQNTVLTEPDIDIFLYRAPLDPFDGLMDIGRGLQIDQFSH